MAAERWAPAWANKHVIIHCDNQPAVSIINKGTTPNAILMPCLRWLFWLSAVFNFPGLILQLQRVISLRALPRSF